MDTSILSWKARWGLISTLLAMLFIAGQLAALFLSIKFLMPEFLARQWSASWFVLIPLFLLIVISTCFIEWFVHRDILHTVVYSFFRDIYRRHGRHHGFTLIYLEKINSNLTRIKSLYTIKEHRQNESVSFPDYMLLAFFAAYTIPLILLQVIFSGLPILLTGYAAVACSYACYEVFHPLEHKPNEWWEKRKNNPIARLLRWYLWPIQRFHEYHHLYPQYNMAIAGFFGMPLADIVLGTYKMPPQSLYDGLLIEPEKLTPPRTNRFVQKLDRWARTRSKRLLAEFHGREQLQLTTQP
ncbi:MAG: hypothetical protein Q7S32_02710 [bacterium]|nr:hypothetical protein [bacterium]